MAKIDTSTIEGYANMTPEQKVAALEAATVPDPDLSGYVSKETFDKVSSELATKKKELKAKMTDDEAAKAQAAEELENLRNTVQTLTDEKTVAQHKANFIAQGYDPELAESSAQAMLKGDMATVFANNKTFLETYAKNIRAEEVKGTPRPAAGKEAPADYSKLIEQAQANGDAASVAYYIRLQEEARLTTK